MRLLMARDSASGSKSSDALLLAPLRIGREEWYIFILRGSREAVAQDRGASLREHVLWH